jgi:hypothetical protein
VLLLIETVLAKIQNGYDLAKVIRRLGGQEIKREIAETLFTDSVLAKIENSFQLEAVIGTLGGKDISLETARKLFTDSVLAKIENGYQLQRVIRELGGKDISRETARKLFTDSVLAKIENSAQLEAVIRELGGRGINPELRDLLIKKILLPKAEALVSKMGFFARRNLRKFITQCDANLAAHADIRTWAALFVASATQAKLYGPKALGEGHQRHSLALLTASLVRHSGMDQSPSC